jgi:hypothetical protein
VTTQGPEGADAGTGAPGAGGPSEEELRAALEEQMRRVTVPDVIVQTVVTLVNVGARRLGLGGGPETAGAVEPGEDERDLEQARLAIEATRALLPLLPEDIGPIREALSQLQMAYAREVQAGATAPPGEGETLGGAREAAGDERQAGAEREGPGAPPGGPSDDPERQKARSKIWTPPGT